MEKVSISSGNSKMGKISSVSLPPKLTCRPGAPCSKKCYAAKIARIRSNVAASYQRNLKILIDDPDGYWQQVKVAVALSKFFRFHVSGDIPDSEYFDRMVCVAKDVSATQILCFTKKYEIVNGYIAFHGELPPNLHIVFSGWPGIEFHNPYNLPEAHVIFRDGNTTANLDIAKHCGGNCQDCAVTDTGCWTLKHGEQVVFNEH